MLAKNKHTLDVHRGKSNGVDRSHGRINARSNQGGISDPLVLSKYSGRHQEVVSIQGVAIISCPSGIVMKIGDDMDDY